jgi:hypothetical protein
MFFNKFFKASSGYKHAALFRSEKYGAIFTSEIERLLDRENPFFMISMDDIIEDHKELKENTTKNEELSNYYVYATFMPPGENKVIVSFDDMSKPDSYYLCNEVVPIREEEVRIYCFHI